MSTHVTGVSVIFQVFLHHFALAKLATSSIRDEQIFDGEITNNSHSNIL